MKYIPMRGLCAALAALALTMAARAAQPQACLIEPQAVAEIGSPVIGVVEALRVERGDRVTKGQVLAVLRADVERAAVSVAHSKVQAEAEAQAAATALEFARQKLVRARDLYAQNFISAMALDQARSEVDLAEGRLAQTREQRQVWSRERDLATMQLAQRSIRSPIDGVVAERYVSAGERVETKPLLRIAQVDPLRVQVIVPAALYGKVAVGSNVSVTPQLPQATPVSARVTLVDPLIDAPSNTFRIQLELPNPGNALPAGLRCKADLGVDATGAEPQNVARGQPGKSTVARQPAGAQNF
jgi:RND family efflux transporter MFP subunit